MRARAFSSARARGMMHAYIAYWPGINHPIVRKRPVELETLCGARHLSSHWRRATSDVKARRVYICITLDDFSLSARVCI